MPKEPLTGGGYDYVQSNAPADPKTGETWYDQSEADATKRGKIYADVGNGAEWVVVPTLSQDDILADGTPFEGGKIGNLDMAVSEAGGSDTDLRFSLTPERVDATQRQTYINNFGSNGFVNSKTAMENVSGSPTVMDTVSASATAMDAVSVSDTALDAIWTSSTAWDIVKAKSMAVGKFAVGRAGLDGANYTDIDDVASTGAAMDAVSTSQTAMDAVSVSTVAMEAIAASSLAMDAVIASDDIALPTVVETETAMDAVSTSDLALDSIWDSSLAWDTVKAKAMAVGKFVAGRAGLDGANFADIDAVASDQSAMDAVAASQTSMDAVATSQLAMDTVAGSQTAMDAVAASTMAYSAAFESDFSIDSLWASTPGAKTILKNSGDHTLPHTESVGTGEATYSVDDGSKSATPSGTAHHLNIFVDGADDSNYAEITYDIDLSNSDSLEVKTKAEGYDDVDFKHGIKVDGDQLFQTSGNNGYTTRTLDISSYGGTHTVAFYHDNAGWNNTDSQYDYDCYFADLNLV